MENYNEELTEMVESLIRTGREDDWWDFTMKIKLHCCTISFALRTTEQTGMHI